MRKIVELGALNALSYFLLTWDLRTVAQANYIYAALSNMAIALLGFTVLKRIQESEHVMSRVSYALGGTIGTLLGIWSSAAVLGK